MSELWGESLAGNAGLGLSGFLLFFPAIALGIVATVLFHGQPIPMILIFGMIILHLIAASVVTSAMKQVLIAGLYFYAADKNVPPGFSEVLLRDIFRAK